MPNDTTSNHTTTTGEKLISVVGLRHYIKGGEAGLPAFFASHPIGSELILQRQGHGSKYPGAIAAIDPEGMACIGTISTDDLHVANCYIPADNYEAIRFARITAHEEKALTIAIPDLTTPDTKPQLRKLESTLGEPTIEYTANELFLQRTASLLLSVTTEARARSYRRYYEDFVSQCHLSHATELRQERRDIAEQLLAMEDRTMHALGEQLRQKHHDLKRRDDLWQNCRDHYMQVCYEADGQTYTPEARRMLDEYEAQLRYRNQDRPLDQRHWLSESQRLRHVIDTNLDGKFASQRGDWSQLGLTIHYADFDRLSLYLLYSRMLQLDFAESHIDRKALTDAAVTDAVRAQKSAIKAQQEASTDAAPSDPTTQLISEVIEILTYFMQRCPAKAVKTINGESYTVDVVLRRDVLNEWLKDLALNLRPELEVYAQDSLAKQTHRLRKAASYVLIGWVVRNTKCFGELPHTQMASILHAQPGCSSACKSIESYITKSRPACPIPRVLSDKLASWFANH